MKKGVRRTVFTVLCMLLLSVDALAAGMLVPGGQVSGIELRRERERLRWERGVR